MIDFARVLESHLVEQMAADEIARQERMRAAWKAYHGDMPKPLKVAAGQPDDNVIVAKARTIVDASVAMMFGSGITFNVGEEGDGSPEDEYLSSVWKANKQATGHIAGNPIVKIIFEDYVSAQTLRKLDVLQEICFNGRHHGIATDILSQDYVGMTPGERDNMDRFILYRPDSGRTRNMIRESFGNDILEIAERVWNNGKALVVCKKKRVPPLERLAWTEGDVAYNKAAIHKNLVLGCNRMWEDVDIKKQKKKRPYVELPSLSTLEAQFNVPIERVEPESDDSEVEDKDLDEALADIDLPKDAKDTAKDIEEAGGKKRPSISSNETPTKKVRFA